MTNIFFVNVVKLNFLICYRLGHLKNLTVVTGHFKKLIVLTSIFLCTLCNSGWLMRKWIENIMTCHLNRDMESQTGSTLVSASAQQKCLLTTAVSYSKYGK